MTCPRLQVVCKVVYRAILQWMHISRTWPYFTAQRFKETFDFLGLRLSRNLSIAVNSGDLKWIRTSCSVWECLNLSSQTGSGLKDWSRAADLLLGLVSTGWCKLQSYESVRKSASYLSSLICLNGQWGQYGKRRIEVWFTWLLELPDRELDEIVCHI